MRIIEQLRETAIGSADGFYISTKETQSKKIYTIKTVCENINIFSIEDYQLINELKNALTDALRYNTQTFYIETWLNLYYKRLTKKLEFQLLHVCPGTPFQTAYVIDEKGVLHKLIIKDYIQIEEIIIHDKSGIWDVFSQVDWTETHFKKLLNRYIGRPFTITNALAARSRDYKMKLKKKKTP